MIETDDVPCLAPLSTEPAWVGFDRSFFAQRSTITADMRIQTALEWTNGQKYL